MAIGRGCNFITARRRLVALCGLLQITLGAASPITHADPPVYTVRFVTPGMSSTGAAAMNEAGDIVGPSSTGSRGWVSHGGAPAVYLPLPPGALYSFPTDINEAGVIVGAAGPNANPDFGGKAVMWTPDGSGGYTIHQFGTLPGHTTSYATAVNNLGDVIGYSSNGTFRYPVLFSAPGGMQDLSSTGVFDPIDINDHRVLIDLSFTTKRLDLNTWEVEDLGVPPGPPSYLATRSVVINEAGQVAGNAIYACCANCDRVAARHSDVTGWGVFSSCGQWNGVSDMNDFGDMVMRLNTAPYVRFGGPGQFLIEDLIVHDVGHWYVFNGGPTINNARQITVGANNLVTGQAGVILLTPNPQNLPDIDADGDVDLADYVWLFDCLSGPGEPVFPGCEPTDLNSDFRLDMRDFLILQAAFTSQ